jgi:predicted ATPase
VKQPEAPFVLSVGIRDDLALVNPGLDLGWVKELPVYVALSRHALALHPHVTFLVGENGSGKSTLIEALAVATGFGPAGGSTRARLWGESHSLLHEALLLERSRMQPLNGFFLRAESFADFATTANADSGPMANENVYDRALHDQSHGESFLALALDRFGPRGLYILDEPEAALSLTGQLALMRRIHELVAAHSQFVVATHSPILLGYPDATIYELNADGIEPREYEETQQYSLTRDFLEDRERFLHHLLADG